VAAYGELIESREDKAWAKAETIAKHGWPEKTQAMPLEALRTETLKRHPELTPKPDDAAKPDR